MRARILINSQSGRLGAMPKHDRVALARDVAAVYRDAGYTVDPDRSVSGFNTTSAPEFRRAAYLASLVAEHIVVLGGDGTFSDVINGVRPAVPTTELPFAHMTPVTSEYSFIPLGTGNALRHVTGVGPDPLEAAERCAGGSLHPMDMLLCNGRHKGVLASVGLDGAVLSVYNRLKERGTNGKKTYIRACAEVLPRYRGSDARVKVGSDTLDLEHATSLMVMKIPFYGLGMNVAPQARPDSGKLHFVGINDWYDLAIGMPMAFSPLGNRMGYQKDAEHIRIHTAAPEMLQIDGTLIGSGTDFVFDVLPAHLQLRY